MVWGRGRAQRFSQEGLLTSSMSFFLSLPTSTSFQSLFAELGLVGRLLSMIEKARDLMLMKPKKKKHMTLVTMEGRATDEAAAATPMSRALRRSEMVANWRAVPATHLPIFSTSTAPLPLVDEDDAELPSTRCSAAGSLPTLHLLRRRLDEEAEEEERGPTMETEGILAPPLA